MRYFLILFSIFFVLGCVPYSDNPLTAPNKEELDSSMLGTWFWKEENEFGCIVGMWVNQTTNGGFTGDEFAGTVSIKLKEDMWLHVPYSS